MGESSPRRRVRSAALTLAAVCTAVAAVVVPVGSAAAAGPFVVDDPLDGVDLSIDGVCATATGTCTLRAAVQEAVAAGGTTVVTFDPAVTIAALSVGGPGGAAEGDLDLAAGTTLQLRGDVVDGTTTTRVDASGLGDRLFEVAAGARLDLQFVSLTGGDTTGDGGAVLNHGELGVATSPDFAGLWTAFWGNHADGHGGAVSSTFDSTVSITDTSTAPTASSVRFQDNSADLGGGSIHLDGAAATLAGSSEGATHDVYVDSGTTPGDGGGIEVLNGGRSEILCRAFVRFSSAARGGNVFIGGSTSGGIVELSGGGLDAGSASEGGAAYVDVGDLAATDDCDGTSTISRSTATGDGGAVYLASYLEIGSDAHLLISGSGARDARDGGGIHVVDGASLIARGRLEIEGTSAERDGGGLSVDAGSAAVPWDSNSLVVSNSGLLSVRSASAGRDGGGISFRGAVAAQLVVDLDQNDAAGRGGGLWMGPQTDANLYQSRVTRNSATVGGGIAQDAASDYLVVLDSTIAGNTASSAGGGVDLGGGGFFASFSTIVDNAPDGVRGTGAGNWELGSSLLARNGGANCVDARSYGSTIADDASCVTVPTDFADAGRFDEVADLLDQQDVGEYHLAEGHPAIDFGDCTDVDGPDQLGTTRPLDGDGDGAAGCDAGAIEAGAMALQRRISGTIRDELDGAPLVGACVVSGSVDGDDWDLSLTGSDGTFEIRSDVGARLVGFFVPSTPVVEPSECDGAAPSADHQAEWYRNVPIELGEGGDVQLPDLAAVQVIDTTGGDVAGIDACLGTGPGAGGDAPCPSGLAPPTTLPPTSAAPPTTAPAAAPSTATPGSVGGDGAARPGRALALTGGAVTLRSLVGGGLVLGGAVLVWRRRRIGPPGA